MLRRISDILKPVVFVLTGLVLQGLMFAVLPLYLTYTPTLFAHFIILSTIFVMAGWSFWFIVKGCNLTIRRGGK